MECVLIRMYVLCLFRSLEMSKIFFYHIFEKKKVLIREETEVSEVKVFDLVIRTEICRSKWLKQ